MIRTDVTPNVTLVDTCRFAVSVRKVTLESGDVTRSESDVTLLPRTSPPPPHPCSLLGIGFRSAAGLKLRCPH